MQKIEKTYLLPPGICTLCESAPVEGQEVVDTLKELVTGFPFKLQGRKYVCDSCIVALGNVVGLVSGEQAAKAVTRAEKAEAALVAVRDHVAAFAAKFDQAALEEVSQKAEPEPQPVVQEPEASVAEAKKPRQKKVADEVAADASPEE